jgi:hypothetical protein
MILFYTEHKFIVFAHDAIVTQAQMSLVLEMRMLKLRVLAHVATL